MHFKPRSQKFPNYGPWKMSSQPQTAIQVLCVKEREENYGVIPTKTADISIAK